MSDYWTMIQMLAEAEASAVGIHQLAHEAINRHDVWSEQERRATCDQLKFFAARSDAIHQRLWEALGLFEPTKEEMQIEATLAQSITITDDVARSLGIEVK